MSAAATKHRVLACASLLTVALLAIVATAGGARDQASRDDQPPSTPTNVRVTAATTSMVGVAWDEATDDVRVTSYEVYGEIRRTRVKEPSVVLDRLACGESFAIWITAVDRAGNRSSAAQVTVATQACRDTSPPTTPSNLRQSAASENAVVLVWDPSRDDTGVVGYGVYRHGALVTVAKEPAATMSGLSCGSVHGFEVDAVDAAGNRSPRGQVWAQTADCAGPPPGDTTPPTLPGSLSVAAATQTSVSLTWSASTDAVGVSGYGVYRGSSLATTVPTPGATVSGLTCGTGYTFAVDAYDAAGNRSGKASVTGTTAACSTPPPGDTTPPTLPGSLSVAAATQTSVSLTWSASTDAVGVSGYGVYRGSSLATTVPTPGATVSGLTCGTGYTFAVDAYDAAGNRSGKASVTGTTAACSTPPPGDTTPPTLPGSLSVAAATQTSVSLTWSASTDAVGVSGYGVYRGSSLATTVPTPGATVSGLTCGTGYTFAVDAYDAAGNRSGKASVTGTTAACSTPPPGDTTPPTLPGSLSVAAATQTSVSLTWSASTDAVGVSGYGVYRGSSLATTVPTPGATVSGLTCGTGYTFAVDAYDAAGNRSGKASVTGTTRPCNDTQAPTAPAEVQPTTRTATSIAVSWSPSSDNVGVAGYGVYRAGTLAGSPSSTSWIFSGLACNTNHTLAVDAVDAAGNRSAKTTVLIATTACPDTSPPTAPTGLAVSGVSQTGATLNWSASSDNVGVAGYDVYAQGAKVGTKTSTNHTYGGLTCGTSYTLGVVAFDAAGNRSGQSNATTTTSACSTPPPGGSWPSSYYTGPAGARNILPPRQGALVGIWDSGGNGTDKIRAREAQVGRVFDIGAGSYGTSTIANFDGKLTKIRDEGRIPLASMHSSHTIAEVNAGAEDEWHRASARAVKALGVPTFVRLFHEFNGEWMRYYTPGDSAADAQPFIAAWRRVVSLWKGEGATNAVFVWHAANSNGTNAQVRYPGDAWVDWVANSSYTYQASQWVGFYQDYADLWQLVGWAREYKTSDPARYNDPRYKPFVDSFGKPFMIGEMGHFEDSRKAQWFRSIKANLVGSFDSKQNGPFSNVLALLYSDYGTEADPNGKTWTIDRPADALAGFRDMVNDPYFKTRG